MRNRLKRELITKENLLKHSGTASLLELQMVGNTHSVLLPLCRHCCLYIKDGHASEAER